MAKFLHFTDHIGTPLYINPNFVIQFRPHKEGGTQILLQQGAEAHWVQVPDEFGDAARMFLDEKESAEKSDSPPKKTKPAE